jgi:dienelactone hydrolase
MTYFFYFLVFLIPLLSQATVRTELLPYKKNGVSMEGLIAFDDKIKGPRPGVVVFPDWMGRGHYSERRAKELAALGYVALAADVYGRGLRAKDQSEASDLATRYKKDRKLMRERALGALEALARDRRVDPKKLGAIGYCFGGTVALELAREGAPLRGAVSFHGGLETPLESTGMYAKILILHGASDPFVKPKEVEEFHKEMTDIKADWQMISYGNAVHSFTNPDAGSDPKSGAAYNRLADERSWRAMKDFFEEVFHK